MAEYTSLDVIGPGAGNRAFDQRTAFFSFTDTSDSF